MKTLAVIGLLLIGSSAQSFSMGHPHNLFAARKHMQTKAVINITRTQPNSAVCSLTAVQITKDTVKKLIATTFSALRSTNTTL